MTITIRRGAALVVCGLAMAATAVAASPAAESARVPHSGSGPWHLVDGSGKVRAGRPVVWENSHHVATMLWQRQDGPSNFTYQTITMAGNGRLAATTSDAFAGQHWGSLSTQPTLLASSGHPLVVFDGARGSSGDYSLGCVYGAQGGSSPWTMQSWSLSHDCQNPVGPAAQNGVGNLVAAWPGGQGLRYRIGTSTIPASGSDGTIVLGHNAAAALAGAAADGSTNQFYTAWTQVFSNNGSDGLYVKNVSANSSPVKAPGSGTNSTNHMGSQGNLAISGRTGQSGVYLLYCSNATTCSLELWRVGSSKAMAVPSSSGAFTEAVSAGPSGRLWVAWYNNSTNRVSVVRTNRAATKFGRPQTLATPCNENGRLGLSGGSSGRLDIAMTCVVNKNSFPTYTYATQLLVPMSVNLSPSTVFNESKHSVAVTVTDVGDPVAHAAVHFGSTTVFTNSSGHATVVVPKGTSVGKHTVTVTATDYRKATATITVKH